MKRLLLLILLSSILIISSCNSSKETTNNGENKITVFKSANCGCCVGYISALKKEGFYVESVNVQNIYATKEEYNIPKNMQSCHTAVIGDYFVEGHVPIEAVKKLLDEKPNIDGIALPAMPSGSLGMPGPKRGEFEVYSLTEGKYSQFMTI